jgi:protein TorT
MYTRNEENIESGNTVEKIMTGNTEGVEISKPMKTEENSNDKVSTQIGKQKLIVNSYYGVYNILSREKGFTLTGLGNAVKEKWVSAKSKKEYKIGVLLPHFEDTYWITIGYGIANYAKELGIKIKLYAVGGYIEIGDQKEQLRTLGEDSDVDGIILGSLDYTKFDSDIEKIADNGKPVVEISNDINAPKISAKSIVSYYEMGYKAGESVIKDASGRDIKIAFFPGPEGSGWAPDTFYGFKDAVSKLKKEKQKIDISEPFYGDTRPNVQRLRVISVLKKNNNYDYLVGCAPAVIEAEKFIAADKEKFKNIKIVSTYITSEVYDLIEKGTVLASPSDQAIQQCRIALDMIVKILNGEKPGIDFPFQSGPEIPIISQNNISQFKYEDLFGSKDYIPLVNHINE